jgi:hypothetical protein
MGQKGASVAELFQHLLQVDNPSNNIGLNCLKCNKWQYVRCSTVFHVIQIDSTANSPAAAIEKAMLRWGSLQTCKISGCDGNTMSDLHFIRSPNILVFEGFNTKTKVSHEVKLRNKSNRNYIFRLVGLIYFRDNHFFAHYVETNMCYFNDGMKSNIFEQDILLKQLKNSSLLNYAGGLLSLAIYCRK